jgi:hypothetical protein
VEVRDFPANTQAQSQPIDLSGMRRITAIKTVKGTLGQIGRHHFCRIFNDKTQVAIGRF